MLPGNPLLNRLLASQYFNAGRKEEAKALFWKAMNASTGKLYDEARLGYERLGGRDHLRGGKPPVTPPVNDGGNFTCMW